MVIGATPLADALFFSFRLANLLRVLFAERAFTLFYIRYIQQNQMIIKRHLGLRIAQYLSRLIFYWFFVLLRRLPFLIWFKFTPEFDQSKLVLIVTLLRIMMPYIIFVSTASLIGGILQIKQHFASTAIALIILNLCQIVNLFTPYIKTPAHNLSIAVLVGGIFQLLLMLFLVHHKLKAAFFKHKIE